MKNLFTYICLSFLLSSCVQVTESVVQQIEENEGAEQVGDGLNNSSHSIEQLRSAVSKVVETNCVSCHGAGGAYQRVIDLSVDIKVLEKNSKYIKPLDPGNSYLYQKVKSGTMSKYLPNAEDIKAIREWIERTDGKEEIVVNCPVGEEELDNVCVTKGKTLRSHGYRMLTPEELFKDINGIFGVNLKNSDPASGLPIVPVPKNLHGFNNQFGLISANSTYVLAVEQVANMLGDTLMKKSNFDPEVVSCMNQSINDCGRTLIDVYLPKMFRRSLNQDETQVYKEYFNSANGEKKEIYINFFKALVQSPSFLFREEHGHAPNPLYNLDPFEVAGRLSYFLTGKSPDEVLRSAASNGSILQKNVREAQAKRLMRDQANQEHLVNVFLKSIGVKDLKHDEDLSADMREETTQLVRDIFFSDNKKWTEVFSSNYTYLNNRLAGLYRMNVQVGDNQFVKVTYPDARRAGILSHASYLSAFYEGKSIEGTKDIRRGINFYEKILCKSMPLPPPDIDIDMDPADELDGCKIENRKNSTSNPSGSCVQCHQHFDPIGMGFERFNNKGEFRTREKNRPECGLMEKFYLSGGRSYNTMPEYGAAIAKEPRVARCLALNMKSYAYGSKTDVSDLESIFLENEKFKSTLNFKDLIIDIVTNDQFLKRESRDEI